MKRPQPRHLAVLSLLAAVGLFLAACTPSSGSSDSSGSAEAETDASTTESATLSSRYPGAYPDRIVLSWEKDPATSLSVTWRTDSTVTAARAQIAVAKAEPSFYTEARTVPADTEEIHTQSGADQNPNAHYHSVTFEDLEPNTLYAYRVGDGTHWSEWIHAETASDTADPFSFVYLGDAQNNLRSHWSRTIRAAYTKEPNADFFLHAGDLVDNAHRNREWGQWNHAGGWIQSMKPNIAVPGNHEYDAFEKWMEEDTLDVTVSVDGVSMTGTILEPDGNPESLEASADGSVDGLFGTWTYIVDGGEYEGKMEITDGSSGPTARLVSKSGDEFPLRDVAVQGDTLTGEFLMEVEKEGEEHLSVHWHPQFTLPRNGPEGMKETVYYVDYQGMRIIGLNSNLRDSTQLRRQTEWLEETLQDTDARWTVVTMHHPMYSSSEGRNNEDLRERWVPLFDAYGVDLVMQGHDHTYARGRRAKNLTQGVNTRSPVGGTVYVNSVSGAKMYEIKKDRWESYDGIEMDRSAENTQLFQVVHVRPDTLKYRSYTVTGEPYDAFNLIQRSGDRPAKMVELDPARSEPRTHENTIQYARP